MAIYKLEELLKLNLKKIQNRSLSFISAKTIDKLEHDLNIENASFFSPKNSIIFIKDGSVGKINFTKEDFNIASTMTSFASENVITTNYLYFWMISNIKTIMKLKRGSIIPHIYFNDLKKLQVNLPSLETQKQIINIIEPMYELLKLLKKERELYQKKFKYFLNKLSKGQI